MNSVKLPAFGPNVHAGVITEGQGERVFVLLPGGPGLSGNTMQFEADTLVSAGRVIMIDPPNVGNSSKALDWFDYGPIDHAKWYSTALDALSVSDCYVLGGSFGGIVALAMAAIRPDLVYRCICVGSRVAGVDLMEQAEADRMESILQSHAAKQWYPEARKTFDDWQELIAKATSSQEIDEHNRKILPFYSHDPDLGGRRKKIEQLADLCEFDVETTKAWEAGLYQRFDIRLLLSHIKAPVLLLDGDSDWMASPAAHASTAKLLPNATVHIVKEAGHLVAIDQPHEFIHTVKDFFGL